MWPHISFTTIGYATLFHSVVVFTENVGSVTGLPLYFAEHSFVWMDYLNVSCIRTEIRDNIY